MKLRKGVVPLILFLAAVAAYVAFTFTNHSRVRLDNAAPSTFAE